VNQLIICGYAVKTLESKETRASKEITVTHISVFAAHRLQCRMTIRKVDIRHFVLLETVCDGYNGDFAYALGTAEWRGFALFFQPRNVPGG
jgi:hypothetical protein